MSPRGFESARQAAEAINARKNSGGGGGVFYLSLPKMNDSAAVRFLEQGDEIYWCWAHEVPRSDRSWGDWIACRDQDGSNIGECPGCDAELTRRFKGYINIIWRNAPVYKRNAEGRLERDSRTNERIITEHKDQVAVWNQGIQVFEELDSKDATFKGLSSRDFKITRKGEGTNTRYSIDPADPDGGPKPFSDADTTLAAEKYDLAQFTTPPSREQWDEKLGKAPAVSGSRGGGARTNPNPFLTER